ncbi:unnamed protein product [Phyllotreta striolata]|uniref:Uncharacterized protein n=1 Tax=Phyllotreta striolata TaxID=444603 RepID=A0A9N9TPV8_PHYSR|nr:unnamed protein product [Phyllotreta striolata]
MTSAIVDLDSSADDDFYDFSDESITAREKICSIPDTILQYNARIRSNRNVSIFDTDPEYSNDGITYLCPGRGRGSVSTIFRPGQPFNYSADDEEEIKRLLKKHSGHVFRNEAIEMRIQNAKKKSSSPMPKDSKDSEFCDASEETNEAVLKLTEVNSSSECSPLTVNSVWPKLEKRNTSPKKKNLVPPPLSAILKSGREEAKTRKESAKSSLNPSAPAFCYASSSHDKESNSLDSNNSRSKEASKKDKRLSRRQRHADVSWREKDDKTVSHSPPILRSPHKETHKTYNSSFNELSSSSSSSAYFDEDVINVSDTSSSDHQYRQATLQGKKYPAKRTFNIHSSADFPTLS